MDWKTLLLGLIKGTLAILADDYVYRARQARARARKEAPPQPKVDDWAEPTRAAAATPIVLETDEGRHFAACSFISVEGYAAPRAQKERQPGESRRTRRRRPQAPEGVQAGLASEPAAEDGATGVRELELASAEEAAGFPNGPAGLDAEGKLGEAAVSRATAACTTPAEPPLPESIHTPSIADLATELLTACRRAAAYKQLRRLVHYHRQHVGSRVCRRARDRVPVYRRAAGNQEIQTGGLYGEG